LKLRCVTIGKRNQFANHPTLVFKDKYGNLQPDHFFTDKIKSTENKLHFRGIPVSHGKLLAELTFGFNEPICFNKVGQLCMVTIGGYESDICNALGWISQELIDWSTIFNAVSPVILQIKQL
jgi:hypothetical protein